MFRRAITRRTLTGSGNALQEGVRGEPQPDVYANPRLPPKQLVRAWDIRPRVAHVAGSLGVQLALDREAEHRADRLRELVDGRRAAGRDVQDLARHVRRASCKQVRLDDVRDVREVASLLAV